MDWNKAGGAAFPLKEPMTHDELGMTLRDYFAAKALQGLISEPVPREKDGETTVTTIMRHAGERFTSPARMFAHCAYAIADAMLAERAK
jgi:hypothetical protein